MHPDFALRAALRLPRYGEASAFVQSWPRGSRSPVRAAGFRKASRGACSLRAILEATGDGMWRGRLGGSSNGVLAIRRGPELATGASRHSRGQSHPRWRECEQVQAWSGRGHWPLFWRRIVRVTKNFRTARAAVWSVYRASGSLRRAGKISAGWRVETSGIRVLSGIFDTQSAAETLEDRW